MLINSPWAPYHWDKSHVSLVEEPVSVDRQHLGRVHMVVAASRPKLQNCEEFPLVPREKSSAA